MRINKIFIFHCLWALSFGASLCAQTLTNKPLFETESVKVVANEKFPQDMESEIFVGTFIPSITNGTPYFRTEGKQNQVKNFVIEAGDFSSVSLLKKEGGTNSYALCLFSFDSEGKVVAFFDLNMDGTWVVKKTPTRSQKTFILFKGQWLAVDKIHGLLSKMPTARSGDKQFAFQGTWKLSN